MELSWPWRFVSLSPAEVEHRREVLDLRGYYAQLSVLLAIIAIRVYRTGARPTVKSQNTATGKRSWWDSPPFQHCTETRRQYLVSFIWLGWLLSLAAWNTGDDYLHLTKSLGHVALSQLPFQVLMSPASYISSKPTSPSFISILTTIPQSSLTPYHRLLGRVIIAPLLISHATLYISFFAQSSHPDYPSLLDKRVLDSDVQWGFGAVSMVIFVIFFVRPLGKRSWMWKGESIREDRWSFYLGHLMLVGALGGAAWCHVKHARPFVLEALIGSLVNVLCWWIS